MASVKFEKGSREWLMFQDYWKLCQKFWTPEDTDQYWLDAIRESREFSKKYKDIPLADEITVAFLNSLNQRAKG